MGNEYEENPVFKDFISSTPLAELVYQKQSVFGLVNEGFEKSQKLINDCAYHAIDEFSKKRDEYNDSADVSELCYLVPEVRPRKRRGQERLYHEYRWCHFANAKYRNASAKGKKWQLRSIKSRGKTHWTELDLKKGMSYKAQEFFPIVLETEHILRFLREQYAQLNFYLQFANKIATPPNLLDLVPSQIKTLNANEYELAEIRDAIQAKAYDEDPLCVSKNASLFEKIYRAPSLTTGGKEDDSDLEEF